MKRWFFPAATGFFSGILNGLFGSGGGIIAAVLYKKSGLSQKESQATALFLTLCLSVVSVFLYYKNGLLVFDDFFGFIPGGIIGAFFAALFYRKMSPDLLRKIFGGFILFSGGRMLLGVVSEWI